jgi:hypothetical protein
MPNSITRRSRRSEWSLRRSKTPLEPPNWSSPTCGFGYRPGRFRLYPGWSGPVLRGVYLRLWVCRAERLIGFQTSYAGSTEIPGAISAASIAALTASASQCRHISIRRDDPHGDYTAMDYDNLSDVQIDVWTRELERLWPVIAGVVNLALAGEPVDTETIADLLDAL